MKQFLLKTLFPCLLVIAFAACSEKRDSQGVSFSTTAPVTADNLVGVNWQTSDGSSPIRSFSLNRTNSEAQLDMLGMASQGGAQFNGTLVLTQGGGGGTPAQGASSNVAANGVVNGELSVNVSGQNIGGNVRLQLDQQCRKLSIYDVEDKKTIIYDAQDQNQRCGSGMADTQIARPRPERPNDGTVTGGTGGPIGGIPGGGTDEPVQDDQVSGQGTVDENDG